MIVLNENDIYSYRASMNIIVKKTKEILDKAEQNEQQMLDKLKLLNGELEDE